MGEPLDPWADDGPARELAEAFLAERCTLDPQRTTFGGDLYAAFAAWAQAAGGQPITRQGFDAALAEAGLERYHGSKGLRWRGVALAESQSGSVVVPRRSRQRGAA